MSATFGSSAV
ncbi:hypothetical protein VTH06DRAFT_5712 [Thermothelomyces fergusii]